jgi:hypothetical protein
VQRKMLLSRVYLRLLHAPMPRIKPTLVTFRFTSKYNPAKFDFSVPGYQIGYSVGADKHF